MRGGMVEVQGEGAAQLCFRLGIPILAAQRDA